MDSSAPRQYDSLAAVLAVDPCYEAYPSVEPTPADPVQQYPGPGPDPDPDPDPDGDGDGDEREPSAPPESVLGAETHVVECANAEAACSPGGRATAATVIRLDACAWLVLDLVLFICCAAAINWVAVHDARTRAIVACFVLFMLAIFGDAVRCVLGLSLSSGIRRWCHLAALLPLYHARLVLSVVVVLLTVVSSVCAYAAAVEHLPSAIVALVTVALALRVPALLIMFWLELQWSGTVH